MNFTVDKNDDIVVIGFRRDLSIESKRRNFYLKVTSDCNIITDVQEENIPDDNLSVYPNPATGILNVTLPESYQNDIISILSIDGKSIEDDINVTTSDQIKIDILSYVPGSYLLKLISKEGVIRYLKFIVVE